MKVVETLDDFPAKVALRGLQLEAYQILQSADKQKPVMKVTLDGQNAAAVKRAFVAAAKALGGSVETRNSDGDAVLVRWSQKPSIGRRGSGTLRARLEHAEADIMAEIRRLWVEKGRSLTALDSADETTKRKMRTSAKRNLSRKANK